MKIWLVTDTHFNHERLKTMGTGRPENYEQTLWDSLQRIPREDTLIHLGDICIGNDEKIHQGISNLQCRKTLVKGNHDNKSDNWYYEHGWDFVCQEVVIKARKKLILLKHIPLPSEHRGELALHIHGHLHGELEREGRMEGGVLLGGGTYDKDWHYDVAPDTHNYQAVTLESIIKDRL